MCSIHFYLFINVQINLDRPELFTFEARLEKTANQNLSLAFHLATAEFACTRLLEPIDMRPENVDARATTVFILELYKAVERDRKRRSRGIMEIQTPAMVSSIILIYLITNIYKLCYLLEKNLIEQTNHYVVLNNPINLFNNHNLLLIISVIIIIICSVKMVRTP